MKYARIEQSIGADGKVIFRLFFTNPKNESLTVEIGQFNEIGILQIQQVLTQALLDAK